LARPVGWGAGALACVSMEGDCLLVGVHRQNELETRDTCQ